MKAKKLLTIVGILVLVVIVINESRFLIWGPFGVPEQPSRPNCGETRYNFNTKIDSKDDFLIFIKTFENRSINIYEGMPDEDRAREHIAQFIMHFSRTPEFVSDVKISTSSSLFFKQKLYSITYENMGGPCSGMTLEIGENGYTSLKGCCGI